MSDATAPYLELSDNPVRFEAVNQVTNVFFDDSNKQQRVTTSSRKSFIEDRSDNNHSKDSSVYFTAENASNVAAYVAMEFGLFETSKDTSNVILKEKDKLVYSTAESASSNNKNLVVDTRKKKRTNFDTYIEEVVKENCKRIQHINDNLISSTPIDIFDDKLFGRVKTIKKGVTASTDTYYNYNSMNVMANTNDANASISYSNNSNIHCNNSNKNINIISDVMLVPPMNVSISTPHHKKEFDILGDIEHFFDGICSNLVKEKLDESNANSSYWKNSNVLSECSIIEKHRQENLLECYTQPASKLQSHNPLLKGWLHKYNQTPIICVQCNITFIKKSSYRSHMFLHESEKYECNICCKRYRRIQHLNSHLKKCRNM